jgi:hypothetical protein
MLVFYHRPDPHFMGNVHMNYRPTNLTGYEHRLGAILCLTQQASADDIADEPTRGVKIEALIESVRGAAEAGGGVLAELECLVRTEDGGPQVAEDRVDPAEPGQLVGPASVHHRARRQRRRLVATCPPLEQLPVAMDDPAVMSAAALRPTKPDGPAQAHELVSTQDLAAVTIQKLVHWHYALELDSSGRHGGGSVSEHALIGAPVAHQVSLAELGAESGFCFCRMSPARLIRMNGFGLGCEERRTRPCFASTLLSCVPAQLEDVA